MNSTEQSLASVNQQINKSVNQQIKIENLVAGYPGRVLVRNLFLWLPEPAFVAVVGHNGSGKTTLFRVLMGQLAYQGSVQLLGQEVRELRRAAAAGLLGYLPQRGSVDFSIGVRELVVMGRYRHHGLLSAYSTADYALADAALARVGMAHLAARDFTQLSGGEQQLVWLAQLSLQDADVYLLDEPTQQLDVYYRRQVFSLVHEWATVQRKTVLCSTHDLDNLPELSGFLLNLSEAEPQLRSISAATVQAARACLEQPPQR
ncbi:ABC transporter ATP-binding protein [Hymenobacter sp. 5317J-9]|uniref:ABC transporter ATP-binding protein n=1 Tax=Hymenobacter sp. 5317J-9 TaxID=2932250 RepID=UPI001FD64E0B|nr:ABC transporter ATP-binding protein [Hymenobacter sp. 5317J-9]UOQ98017.1 ABC transporter ATP-binding protein [Hymenobacter sp. 5317J-9]